MIRKFLDRSIRYNEQMMDAVRRLGLVSVDIETASSPEQLSDICLDLLCKSKL